MLTQPELVALARSLRDERVLSVYLDGSTVDPKARRVWRLELDHQLKNIRQNIQGTSHSERTLFDDCVTQLEKELVRFDGALGAPGWAGFITAEGAKYAELLPVPMPTVASWRKGPRVAPYVRALKQNQAVIVIVADKLDAKMYRYVQGTLEHLDDLHARVVTDQPYHMSKAPRLGFHSGLRGTPGRDETQRELNVASQRMMSETAQRVLRAAWDGAWILVGGIPAASTRLMQELDEVAPGRVRQLASLDVHATLAEITTAVRQGASQLRDDLDSQRIGDMVDREQAIGLAVVGRTATDRALQQKRVRELYLTHGFLEDHVRDAEDAVRDALDQGAAVEEVERRAAERLDRHGGIAARLRYRLAAEADRGAEDVVQH